MAKVLFAVPVGQDMGGIITSTEQYVAGLRDAGHEVTPICVVFTKRDEPWGSMPRGKLAEDYVAGPGTGWLLHPIAGWRSEARVSLGCEEGIDRWLKLANGHDLVIWASMYGFRNDATEGQMAWVRAIAKLKTKQIFMIHDDHIKARYPWALALAKHARAYVGVQPCSYDSLEGVAAPRAMVYTPLPAPPSKIRPMEERSGFLNCQVWKTWKNGDKLVAAAPLMPKKSVTFAGDGLQLRYMRSPNKCPPRYTGLWAAAMKKQSYAGVLSEAERDAYLGKAKFLVDLSLRHNSGQYNRIAQEAMAQGCVVIANPEFITGTRDLPLFVPWKHYLPITETEYAPKDLAATLKAYEGLDKKKYADIQSAARKLLSIFERKRLAEQLVACGDMSSGEHVDTELYKRARQEFERVFGGKP